MRYELGIMERQAFGSWTYHGIMLVMLWAMDRAVQACVHCLRSSIRQFILVRGATLNARCLC